MKRIFIVLLALIIITGCSKNQTPESINYIEIESSKVDMSGYKEMNSVDHQFKQISPDELFRVIKEDGSGAFYFGSTNCPSCQDMVHYINKAASDLDVTIYYLDAYSEIYPIDKEDQEELYNVLYPILEEREGKKTLLTPHFFVVVNGEFTSSQVGRIVEDDNKIIDKYKEMIEILK